MKRVGYYTYVFVLGAIFGASAYLLTGAVQHVICEVLKWR